MPEVRPMSVDDVDWAVGVLSARRTTLAPHAPVYWRPAPDAERRHADHLRHLLGEGEGFGFRTEVGLMIVVPGRRGWTVDDAWVPTEAWDDDGLALWRRVIGRLGGDPMWFVCPVFEVERGRFARDRGLTPDCSWWHLEVPRAGKANAEPRLAGAVVSLVPAPPVYDPGGPVTFVREVEDPDAIGRAAAEAQRCGSPLVVVEQPAADGDLARVLAEHGYVRHCDFFSG